MALKTDYKDDVLDTSKNINRKYYLTNNADNTVSLTDVTSYIQEGDAFGSNDINQTNAKVNEIDESLNGFSFGVTADGKPGYKRGASTEIIPFKTTEVYYLGSSTSYNIRTMFPSIDYRKLTSSNFIAGIKTCYVESSFNDLAGTQGRRSRIDSEYGNRGMATVSVSYDPSNGNLSISGAGATGWNYANADNPPSGTLYRSGLFVYLVIGEIK